MKRIIAIWLLLLYAQAALGISFDSCDCSRKQVKIVVLRLTAACTLCGGDPSAMECCQTETSFGKADQHKLPAATGLSTSSAATEKPGTTFFLLTIAPMGEHLEGQVHRRIVGKSRPSRFILSLVQCYRI